MARKSYDQLLQECREFHKKHPDVWELFERFTLQLINRGFRNYSARGVWHRIRWETAVPLKTADEKYKLPNNHTPFYARAFMKRYPQYEGFFRIRNQISKRN